MKKKKVKNVSINVLEDACKDGEDVYENIHYEQNNAVIDFVLKKKLSLTEILQFSKAVVDNLFEKVNDKWFYFPELHDVSVDAAFICAYTNLTLPNGAERQYSILNSPVCKDILTLCHSKIDSEQFSGLMDSVCEEIDFKKKQIVHENKFDEVATKISEMVSKLEKTIPYDDLKKLPKDIAKISEFDEKKIADYAIDSHKLPEETELHHGKIIELKKEQE